MVRTLSALWGDVTQEPVIHLTIQYLHELGTGSHLTKLFAESLRIHTAPPLTSLRAHWDADLRQPVIDREWDSMLESPTRIPRNARFRLIQYYIIHEAYLMPELINKYFDRNDACCARCGEIGADLLHLLWSCPVIQTY